MKLLSLVLVLALPSFAAEPFNQMEAFQKEDAGRFGFALRQAERKFPTCVESARRLGSLVPTGYVYTPGETLYAHFVFEIHDKEGKHVGELEIAGRKARAVKMLSIQSCEVFPK